MAKQDLLGAGEAVMRWPWSKAVFLTGVPQGVFAVSVGNMAQGPAQVPGEDRPGRREGTLVLPAG